MSPEEDWVVPGNNMSSLSQNTELGKAVSAACDEMDTLGGLENGVLKEADDILKKFGFQKSLFDGEPEQLQEGWPSEDSESSS